MMSTLGFCECGHRIESHHSGCGCLDGICPCAKVYPRSNPPPVPNATTPIWDLVIADMKTRDHVGRQRYGTPLQAHNGRDALQDAYEEAMDLAVYLRQAIEERKSKS